MGFLDDLLRGAAEQAHRVYNQVNPFDGGLNYNSPVNQPQQQRPQAAPVRQAPQYSPQVQQRLAQQARQVQQSRANIYNPLNIAGDIGKGIGDTIAGAGHLVTDQINGLGNRVADFGQAGAEVIREATGQNQADFNRINQQAQEYQRMAQSFAQRAQSEANPQKRQQYINMVNSLQNGINDLQTRNNQDIQRGLQATDPRKTLTNAAETALDVATAGRGSAVLHGLEPAAAQVTKQTLKQLAKNSARVAGEGAGLGAAYGGVNTARDQNATIADYARNMGTGAAAGAALGVGAQIAAPVIGKGIVKGAEVGKKQLDKAAAAHQQTIFNAAAETSPTVHVLPEHIAPFEAQINPQAVQAAAKDILNGNAKPVIMTKDANGIMTPVANHEYLAAYQALQSENIPTRTVTPSQLRMARSGGYVAGPLAGDFKKAQEAGRVFEGVDGKPRFEVTDHEARLVSVGDAKAPLENLLDHPTLYKNYPQLRKLPVDIKIDKNYKGGERGQFTDRGGIEIYAKNHAEAKATLLHELQHAIQHKEGFAGGGAPVENYALQNKLAKDMLRKTNEALYKAIPNSDEFFSLRNKRNELIKAVDASQDQYGRVHSTEKAMQDYKNLAGEAEARAVAARRNMTDGERYAKPKDIWYHGTNAEFEKFDQSKIGSTTDDGIFGRGFYFSNNKKFAENAPRGGAKHVMEVQPNLKNPLDLSKFKTKEELAKYLDMSEYALSQYEGGFARPKYDMVRQFTSHVKEKGHDGVLIPHTKRGAIGDELVVFDAESITKANPRSTFYDSLDVPKKDLIVRNGDGVAMSIDSKKKQLPNFTENSLTKGGKAGRQNLSPEVQAGLEGSHAVRNTKDLQEAAIANADNMTTDDLISGAHEALAVPMGKIDDTTVAHVQQAIERADMEGRTKDAIDLHDALSEHLTKQGQTIQAASLLYRLSPQGLFYKGMNDLKKGGANITPELQGQLQGLAETIKNATDQATKERARAAFQKLVADNLPQSATKNIISVWKAGLLSGAKTQGGNFVSNGTFGALKKVSDLPATAIDAGISAFTKQRTKALTGKGIVSGTKQGLSGAVDTMKTGIDARNINGDKYEIHGEINFKNPVIQKIFGNPSNLVFRSMSAADQPFYYASFQNTLNELAKVEGINKGLKGKELTAYTKNTVANPSTKLAEQAKAAAEKAVLGQDNKIASAVTGLTNKFPAAGVLVPFVKVPTNFIGRVLDYTPVGAVSQAVKQIRAGKFDQRALSEALGEATTGSAIIFLGAELANNNLLSGQYPTGDQKEAQRWKAEGITPNSVKIGDKWIGLNYLGPVGLLFGAGKDFHDAAAKGDNGTIASIAGLGKNLTGQSFLTGFSGFSNAIQDPQRSAGSFVNSQAGSVIPSWLNDMANLADNKQRETNSPLDAMKSRTPGARNTLPIKQDVYGNELDQRANRLDQWLNPLKPSNNVTSPTLSEVNRLHTADPNNKDLQVTPTPIDKKVSFGGKGADGKPITTALTDTQRHDLQKQVGQATQEAWGELIKTDKYKALDDEGKANALTQLKQKVAEAETARYGMSKGLGQYATDFNGKKASVSKGAQTFLTGQPDITSFAKVKSNTSSTTTAIADTLNSSDKDLLSKYDALSTDEKKAYIKSSPDAEFKYEVAKYNNDKASGKLSDVADIRAQAKLAKLQAGKDYSKDTRDLYSLSKAQIYDYVTKNQNGDKLAKELLAYDQSLYDAGLTNYLKFKTGIAPAAKGRSGGSKAKTVRSSTGRKSTSTAAAKSSLTALSNATTSGISTTGTLNRKVSSVKVANVSKRSLPTMKSGKGITAYKKPAKTNVSMTRKA